VYNRSGMVHSEEDLRSEDQAKTHSDPISTLGIRETVPDQHKCGKIQQVFYQLRRFRHRKETKGGQALMENNYH